MTQRKEETALQDYLTKAKHISDLEAQKRNCLALSFGAANANATMLSFRLRCDLGEIKAQIHKENMKQGVV